MILVKYAGRDVNKQLGKSGCGGMHRNHSKQMVTAGIGIIIITPE